MFSVRSSKAENNPLSNLNLALTVRFPVYGIVRRVKNAVKSIRDVFLCAPPSRLRTMRYSRRTRKTTSEVGFAQAVIIIIRRTRDGRFSVNITRDNGEKLPTASPYYYYYYCFSYCCCYYFTARLATAGRRLHVWDPGAIGSGKIEKRVHETNERPKGRCYRCGVCNAEASSVRRRVGFAEKRRFLAVYTPLDPELETESSIRKAPCTMRQYTHLNTTRKLPGAYRVVCLRRETIIGGRFRKHFWWPSFFAQKFDWKLPAKKSEKQKKKFIRISRKYRWLFSLILIA